MRVQGAKNKEFVLIGVNPVRNWVLSLCSSFLRGYKLCWVLGFFGVIMGVWDCFYIFVLCVCNACDKEYNSQRIKLVARAP